MILVDSVEISGTHFTREGYLVADARVSRVGVQRYLGVEVGRPDLPVVSVYRPEEEVFRDRSMASFAHRPVTVGHPRDAVGAATWKSVAAGSIGGEVARDGEFVRVPLIVMDGSAIAQVQNGTQEISMGYRCRLEFADGVTPSGEPYQAIQRDIVINHAAIVPKGRAGPECRIGDGRPAEADLEPAQKTRNLTGDRQMADVTLTTAVVDGITIQTTDQGKQALDKVQKQLGDAVANALAKDQALGTAKADHVTALQAKDGEIAALKAEHGKALEAKDGEIKALTAKIPDVAALDAMASARADLIGHAKQVLGDSFAPAGKTDADIRKAVVAHALGDAAKDMTDAEVDGAFKVVASGTIAADPIRSALRTASVGDAADPRRTAFKEMTDHYANAWKATA